MFRIFLLPVALLFIGADPATDAPVPIEELLRNAREGDTANRVAAIEALVETPVARGDLVPILIKAAEDDDPSVHRAALIALSELGPAAKPAINLLVKLLASKDLADQYEALYGLGRIGPAAKTAVEPIEKLLKSPDELVRVLAIWALARIDSRGDGALKAHVPALIGGLKSRREDIRSEAATVLVQLGPVAVPALVDALKGASPAVTTSIIDTLTQIGPQAKAAIPTLTAALKNSDVTVRWHAARALGVMKADATAAIPALAAALTDKSPVVRRHAATALGHIPAAAKDPKALVNALADSDQHVSLAAVRALKRLKVAPETLVPKLIQLLSDAPPSLAVHALDIVADAGPAAVGPLTKALANERSRYWACLALSDLGPAAKSAVPALVDSLADKRPEVLMQVLQALAAIGPDAAAAVPDIAKVVADDKADPNVRTAAAFALGSIGEAASAGKPALLALIEAKPADDVGEFLQAVSAWSLAMISPDDHDAAAKAIPVLVHALASKNPRIRGGAARALVNLRAHSNQPTDALLEVLETAPEDVAANMLDGLAELGADAVPAAIKSLSNERARYWGARVISRLGPVAKEAVPALAALLNDPQAPIRSEVLFALGAIGPDAASTVPAIQAAVGDANEQVRYSAVYALGRIGPPAAGAIDLLKEKLKDPDEFLDLVSAWALVQIDAKNDQIATLVVPILISGMQHHAPMARKQAAEALGQLGPKAKAAVPTLTAAANDSEALVRNAATEALKKIKG